MGGYFVLAKTVGHAHCPTFSRFKRDCRIRAVLWIPIHTLYSDPPPEICHNWDPVSDSDPSRLTGFHNQLFENAKTVCFNLFLFILF